MPSPSKLFIAFAALVTIHNVPVCGDELTEKPEFSDAVVKLTKNDRAFRNRDLAQTMIEYGRQNQKPEMLLLAAEILHNNPCEVVVGEDDEGERLTNLIEQAVDMRPEDDQLIAMAERALGTLEEATRGLAGGPKYWRVKIPKGKYYELQPALVYNALETARVVAIGADPKAHLGIAYKSVHDGGARRLASGIGKAMAQWDAGRIATGWTVRIYNLDGPDGMEVTIETN